MRSSSSKKVKAYKLPFKFIFKIACLAGLLTLFFIIINVLWDTHDEHAVEKIEIIEEEEPLIISKPIVREFDNNTLTLQLVAEKARIFEQKQITKLNDIQIHLYDSKLKSPSTKIVAQSGEMKSEEGVMRLWGQVRIDTKGNQTLKTEEIFLNQKQNIIYNKSTVLVTTEDDEIISSALHYNISTGILVLEQPEAKIRL